MTNILLYTVLFGIFLTLTAYCGVYMVPERTQVAYCNEKYFYNYSFFIKKYGRKSAYYINIETTLTTEWNDNVTIHIVFYEYLHNEYRRSFIELHYKFCDMLKFEKFVGSEVRSYGVTCPLPPGTIRMTNMTVPLEEFPNVFPFERARVDIDVMVTATEESMLKLHLFASFKNRVHGKGKTKKIH